jgi:hypothetical protein
MSAVLTGAPYGQTETGAAYTEAATVPYTRDEMTDDINDWACATPEQCAAALGTLLAAVTADAYTKQDRDLIRRLRQIRVHLIGIPT